MNYDVKVNIDLAMPIGKVGFGNPLIIAEGHTADVAYTEVSTLAELVAAGFDDKTTAYKAAQLIFMQENAPKKIAVIGTTGAATDELDKDAVISKDWRQLIVVAESAAEPADGEGSEATVSTVADIMAKVETLTGKVYFASLDTDDATDLTVDGIRRTVLFYCDATEDVPVPVAALVGDIAGREPGSFTYKNLILKGIKPQVLSDAEVNAIHEKGGITFVTKAGDNVTSEGKTAGGEYIDIIDSEDYIVQQLAYRTQKVLNSSAKVPYDNNGIGLLESIAVDVLQGAYNNGMIATKEDGSPDYSVSYAMREDTAEADRATRKYLGGRFSFALAGAIHYVEITGTISY